ncbi:MAG: hypothetical protein ACI4ED_08330 [Suilimivivens sp.]
MTGTEIRQFIGKLCKYAGEDEKFADDFYERLKADEEILREFVYYMLYGNFACRAKVLDYTVVDVMIWQMDHFKAWLDRDTAGTKQNGDRMLLMAFDTLLKMRENPEKYVQKIQLETGTDYEGKYE